MVVVVVADDDEVVVGAAAAATAEVDGCGGFFLAGGVALMLEEATTTDTVPRQIPPEKRSAGTYGWLIILPFSCSSAVESKYSTRVPLGRHTRYLLDQQLRSPPARCLLVYRPVCPVLM